MKKISISTRSQDIETIKNFCQETGRKISPFLIASAKKTILEEKRNGNVKDFKQLMESL